MADETKDPLREAAEKAIEEIRAIGQAWRDDWSDFDGRTLKGQLWAATEPLRAALSAVSAPSPGTRPPDRAEDIRILEAAANAQSTAARAQALRDAADLLRSIDAYADSVADRLSGSATGAPLTDVDGASCPACGMGIVLATCDNPACRETWIGERAARALDKRHNEKRCPTGACARCDPGHMTESPRCPKEGPGCTGGVCEACGLWHCMSHLRDGAQFTSELAACPGAPREEATGEATRECPVPNCHAGMLRSRDGRDSISCPVCDGVLTPEGYRSLVALHEPAAPPGSPRSEEGKP